jgi:putative acetyltransferase
LKLRRPFPTLNFSFCDSLGLVQICQAITAEEITIIRGLFQEYAAWLKVDLCFQRFSEELASLPGAYAMPRGRLLLATAVDGPAGCVALRPIDEDSCEMKRLFVRPAYRGQGLGGMMAERIVSEARAIGYTSMMLDTLPFMRDAIHLYRSLGFVERPAYYETPLAETVFMELRM